jgi:hypothetical protein
MGQTSFGMILITHHQAATQGPPGKKTERSGSFLPCQTERLGSIIQQSN